MGHTMCDKCTKRIKTCYMCRTRLPEGGIRCLVLEQTRAVMEIKCKFDQCKVVCAGFYQWRKHVEKCKFNVFSCPHPGCGKTGTDKEISEHRVVCVMRSIACPLKTLSANRACEEHMLPSGAMAHLHEKHGCVFKQVQRAVPYNFGFEVTPNQAARGGKWTNYFMTEQVCVTFHSFH